tara:strand:+ start:327 stop:878 length:552 start_codon:yes stop_codon:yes gene_type:complete
MRRRLRFLSGRAIGVRVRVAVAEGTASVARCGRSLGKLLNRVMGSVRSVGAKNRHPRAVLRGRWLNPERETQIKQAAKRAAIRVRRGHPKSVGVVRGASGLVRRRRSARRGLSKPGAMTHRPRAKVLQRVGRRRSVGVVGVVVGVNQAQLAAELAVQMAVQMVVQMVVRAVVRTVVRVVGTDF